MEHRFSRRAFIKLSAVGLIGATAAACSSQSLETPPATEVPELPSSVPTSKVEAVTDAEAVEKYNEPPLLQVRVAAGDLPPVAERLPEAPLVVGGREASGDYGGEVRMIHYGTDVFYSNYDLNAERFLVFSDLDLRTIVPNIFESYEVSPDAREWTLRLRRGMKWSDGTPLTMEDVRFWWEDISNDPEVNPWDWEWQFRFGGERVKLEFLDETTFKLTFAKPFGSFAMHLTRWEPGFHFLCPSHYLKQFHARYTDQAALEALAEEAGLEGWVALFWEKMGFGIGIWTGPQNWRESPTLSPWIIVDNPQEGLYLWERNPYYWKVDQAGNQLPYFDSLRYDSIQTGDQMKLKLIQSELDLVGSMDVTIADYAYYKENEAQCNYMVGDLLSCLSDRYILFPQFYITDEPVLTELTNHPNFVKALSVAIDRAEINESLFFGLARMGAASPMPGSKYYKEAYGSAWAQYDPDLANQHLDEMGLEQRDGDGFRLRPDGERLSYIIQHTGLRIGPAAGKLTEMVTSYWRAVGIDAVTKEIDYALYSQRMYGAEVHCGVWHQDRVTDLLMPIEMNWFIPVSGGQGGASAKWAEWYLAEDRTAEGLIEPPAHIRQLYEWHDKMIEVASEEERVASGQKIFDWLAENPLAIGLVLECPAPVLYNKNLRNLPPSKAPLGWDTYGFSTYHPEAFFYQGGKRA
jgi:peptide/nickel transport system substrate-binding protein